jgi:D-inositol-3-phosphate glycosyltransferase
VAAAVGGLRTLVEHGETGLLVEERQPEAFARAVDALLVDSAKARAMSDAAATRARGYTWSTTAARLRRLYADLTARRPVDCTA